MPQQAEKQEAIVEGLSPDSPASHWIDWKWQLRHSIRDIDTFQRLAGIEYEPEMRARLDETLSLFPLSVTPYYFSLIDFSDYDNDPIYKQSFPVPLELDIVDQEMGDPLHEDADSPVPGITHRYPDRVLFCISNMCSMYCRHCTRKRKVGDSDFIPDKSALKQGVEYVRSNPAVRDVLLSGGDPLMLSNELLDWILNELRQIEHVEIIRIGTRMPVVLPYRITSELVDILKKYHPLWINTHFNHPRELTTAARKSLAMLADAGIPLGNQTVLLSGVNDCPRIIKTLVQKLVQNRVRPYYLYQCDMSEGLSHFRTPVSKGIEIIERLVGHTSGLCVPTYVIDAPGGGGKIPIMPQYQISASTNKVVLRNYEGVITTYHEPSSYEPFFCDRQCDNCSLQLKLEESYEHEPIGIAKLLDDVNDAIALTPSDNERHERRTGDALD